MTYALVKSLVVNRVNIFAIYLFVFKVLRCFDQNYFTKVKNRSKISAFFAKMSMIYKT